MVHVSLCDSIVFVPGNAEPSSSGPEESGTDAESDDADQAFGWAVATSSHRAVVEPAHFDGPVMA